MSYVLDALKKADAERERGAVPGLHAQPIPGPMGEASGERALPAWVWFLLLTTSLLLLALLWLLLARDHAPATPPVTVSQAPATAQAPASQAVLPPMQEAARPAERATPATSRSEPPRLLPRSNTSAQVKPAITERPVAPPAAAPRRQEPTTVALERRNPAPPPAAAAVSPKPTANSEERIFALKELPEDVRRVLPPLNVGGSIYSENPAGRFVIINGQVFHENDKLAPDLTLEQIRLKLAVLRYKDVRFRIMF